MDAVKSQYEAYPYPARDPAEEDKRLVTGSPSSIAEIDHYLFAGRRDWSQPFRVLVAGGGTGDGLIMIAQQLADVGCPAEITYLDLSEASRAIAEARAKRRGLSNIRFETASLLDAKDYGPFDYIDCCGVLHHLPDPDAGFAALKLALAPGGGIGIMVYGTVGRSGVYDAQAMLRALRKEDEPAKSQVETAKHLLKALPDSNQFRRNPFLSDHTDNDAGLFDLLLHSQDRAYLVPEIYEALGKAGLSLVSFVAPMNYDTDFLVSDAKLKARLTRLSRPEREAFAELLTGNLRKHVFYCVPEDPPERVAQFGEDMIPVLHDLDLDTIVKSIAGGKPIKGRREGLKIEVPMPPLAAEVLPLCDGKRSFEEIRQMMEPLPGRDTFYDQMRHAYRGLNGLNMMLLRQGAE